MEPTDFDALTRQLGTIDRKTALKMLSGFLAVLAGAQITEGKSDKKKRKKRKRRKKRARRKQQCIVLGEACQPEGIPCCDSRTCGGPPPGRFCCKQGGEPCAIGPDCCNLQCFQGACALN